MILNAFPQVKFVRAIVTSQKLNAALLALTKSCLILQSGNVIRMEIRNVLTNILLAMANA